MRLRFQEVISRILQMELKLLSRHHMKLVLKHIYWMRVKYMFRILKSESQAVWDELIPEELRNQWTPI